MIISSRSNPAVKNIRALRDRKRREQAGLYFVEGIRIVTEAAQVGAPVQEVIVAPELLKSQLGLQTVETLKRNGAPCLEVTGDVFESLSTRDNPQGLGGVLRQHWTPLSSLSVGNDPTWIALSGVQDAGNLGTILRTADAVGCAGVILLGPTTDPFDPEAVRASMGAVFTQHLVRATLGEVAAWRTRHGYLMAGTSDAGAIDYQAYPYPARLIVLMGSEQHGLSREEQAACDVMVRIPMVGRSDSLNLGVATALVLYEVFNQRRAKGIMPASGRTLR